MKDGSIVSYANPLVQKLTYVFPSAEESLQDSGFEIMLFSFVCLLLFGMIVYKFFSSASQYSRQKRLEETITRALRQVEQLQAEKQPLTERAADLVLALV